MKEALDYPRRKISENQKKIRHFGFFALIVVGLLTLVNYIGREASPKDLTMKFLNILAFLEFPVIFILMIKSYRGKELLLFTEKLILLISFVLFNIIVTVLINWINPFDREISTVDLVNGAKTTSIFYLVMFVIAFPFLFLNSKRLLTKTK